MRNLLLKLLALFEDQVIQSTGQRAQMSGVWLCLYCKKQYMPLSKGERFPPCLNQSVDWKLVVRLD